MYDEDGNDDCGGELLPVVSGTGVVIGEDLIEVTVARWVLRCASQLCVCCIRSALANWKGTRDKRTRDCTAAKKRDFEKHAKRYHQPREREDVESLHDILEISCASARYGRDTLVQLLRRIAIMSENQTRYGGDDRVWNEFFDWHSGGDDYSYESKLWSHDRIHMALNEEWTRHDGDVKKVLVKFSDEPELEYRC